MGEVGSLLDQLGDDERRQVLSVARRRRFKRGEIIFHEGDPGDSFHLVEKGHVAIRVSTPLGDVATLTVVGPGEGFGEGALLAADSRRTASAVALDATETRSIARDEFERLRVENPRVETFLTHLLAEQVRRLSAHLLEALYTSVETRVLRRLVMLGESYGDAGTGGIVVPITQDDLASMAGTTRPTANRVLKAAEDDGLVRVSRGKVEIVDLDALARRAR